MFVFSSMTLCPLLAAFCSSLIAFFFTTLPTYVSRSGMSQQIAPPHSTLPYPKDLTLRYVGLGIGHQTYQCSELDDWPELQSSYSKHSQCYL